MLSKINLNVTIIYKFFFYEEVVYNNILQMRFNFNIEFNH